MPNEILEACQLLGVHYDDPNLEEVARKSFRKLSKEHHPDKGGDEEQFKQLNNAYNTIKNFLKDPFINQGITNPGFDVGFGININGMNINVQPGQTVHQHIDEHGNIHITFQM